MPQKLRCKVEELIDHGESVYSIFLRLEAPSPRFLPGQFLHLALDPYTPGDFWPESRVFSIASPPSDRNLLRITYAVKGKFSYRMESEIRCGTEVWIKLPYGEFTIKPAAGVCLLAGGTGVTAFTAFLSDLTTDYPFAVYLFYAARTENLLVYRSLVDSAAQKCPNLHKYYQVEAGQVPDFLTGRINLDDVWKIVPSPQDLTYYLSGPPIMLKNLYAGLTERMIKTAQILTDAWE